MAEYATLSRRERCSLAAIDTVIVAFLDAEESHGCHVSHLLPSDGLLTVIGGLSPTHCM